MAFIIMACAIIVALIRYSQHSPTDKSVTQIQAVSAEKQTEADNSEVKTAVVGANPTAARRSQSFAPPSNDTNVIAQVAMEQSVRAAAALKAYQEAARLNRVQEIKPGSPMAAR